MTNEEIIKKINDLAVDHLENGPYRNEGFRAVRLCKTIMDFCSQAEKNEPLTLEELREMDGEPVWCESDLRPEGTGWYLVDATAQQPHEFIVVGKNRSIPCAGIETGYWKAYRRKPEEASADG